MSEITTSGARRVELRYFDGSRRLASVLDREVPFPDGKIIVSRTDPDGLITHANQTFVEMSGYPVDELLGQPHHILRHPDMPQQLFAEMWRTVQSGKRWHGYIKNLRKDGAFYWVKATVMPNIRLGKLLGYTSVRKEPSRIKVAECEALYARLRAEQD
ncbi:PAS domain-containing protein [Marinobacterium arenosum]|uniref:PAS domain-containing protein n=1 Tax=Marinobacterium arenosum TaxID=2862496 RepID=UPI001C965B7F|nr:PAS domain-containing protein [Marinobacterium arenosum]MBY4675093.1 PAS domain-containing protein [Marinobacterium arenosum]